MKTIKLILATVLFTIAFTACTDDTEEPIIMADENPLAEYNRLITLEANGHEIEIYSEQTQFSIGYNELFFRIKAVATDTYVSDASISMMPVMHMTEMMHSCPKSAILKTDNDSVYKGFAVFQMPSNADEYWDLSLAYAFGDESFEAKNRIEVKLPVDGKKRVASFMGNDDSHYIVAMLPITPEVAVNDISAMVFKMQSMMEFPVIENYTLSIDPRMPSMGNHSSPNNRDLTYDANTGIYQGKLSLTMTGYWKINLKVLNEMDELIKGEDITEENESSSLFFEIEF